MTLIRNILLVSLAASFGSPARGEGSPIQKAWVVADEARELARKGHQDLAIDLYRQAIEIAPDVATIRRDYAVVLGWSGDYAAASREFLRVTALQPKQPEWAQREMASAHLFADRNEEALALFDSLYTAGYREETLLTRRGLSLMRVGRLAEAEAAYREALGLYPDSEPAAIGVVQSVADQGRVADAYTIAVSWGAGKPEDSEIRVLIAKLLTKIGRYQDSLDAFDRLPLQIQERPEVAVSRVLAARLAGDPRLFLSDFSGSFYMAGNAIPIDYSMLSTTAHELNYSPRMVAEYLRDHGVALGRDGEPMAGVGYVKWALDFDPGNLDVRRDYAVVLNWAEEYQQAREQFERVFAAEQEQPAWVRSEAAHADLFGGAPETALVSLNGLIEEGEENAKLLSKKGLALRWTGNSEAAADTYREVMERFPDTPDGPSGLIHSLADRHRFSEALSVASHALSRFPRDWGLRTTQAQVMNWAGLHVRARKTLDEIPLELRSNGAVMHHRALAARWSSRPREAYRIAWNYSQTHPGDTQAQALLKDLSYEYGSAIRIEAEAVGDSTGYSYRGIQETIEVALNKSHRVRLAHGFRRYRDETFPEGDQTTVRNSYTVGWNGSLGKRITADASVTQMDFAFQGPSSRLLYNASVRALATDRLRFGAGVGSEAVETTRALRDRLIANSMWGEAEFKPLLKLESAVRYSRTEFNDHINVSRDVVAFNMFRTFSNKWGHRLRVGGRSLLMRHNRDHPDLWSPGTFSTHLGVVHARGRLSGKLDYVVEAAMGIQREDGFDRQIPVVGTLELARRLKPGVWLRLRSGYSNSGLDRINSGASVYRFWYARGGLDVRLGKWL